MLPVSDDSAQVIFHVERILQDTILAALRHKTLFVGRMMQS